MHNSFYKLQLLIFMLHRTYTIIGKTFLTTCDNWKWLIIYVYNYTAGLGFSCVQIIYVIVKIVTPCFNGPSFLSRSLVEWCTEYIQQWSVDASNCGWILEKYLQNMIQCCSLEDMRFVSHSDDLDWLSCWTIIVCDCSMKAYALNIIM